MTQTDRKLARLREANSMDRGLSGYSLHLFRLRFRRLRLSQRAFAERYGLGFAQTRNVEQGQEPTPAFRVLIAAIAADPVGMRRIAKAALTECRCADIPADKHCSTWAINSAAD